MERYHIFKLGLAILFYAAYCIRPMVVDGQKVDGSKSTPKFKEEDLVFYQGVEGKPGVDFPVLSYIPRTSFTCRDVESGYYADLETDCQVFHICEDNKKISFLCPNGTIFQQSELICEWWFKVNCTNSPSLYEESAEQLREDNARRKLSRRVQNHGAVMRTEEKSSVSVKSGRNLAVVPNRASKRVFTEADGQDNRIHNHAATYRDELDHNDLSRSSSSDFVRDRNQPVPPQKVNEEEKRPRGRKPVQFQQSPRVDNDDRRQRTGGRRAQANSRSKQRQNENSRRNGNQQAEERNYFESNQRDFQQNFEQRSGKSFGRTKQKSNSYTTNSFITTFDDHTQKTTTPEGTGSRRTTFYQTTYGSRVRARVDNQEKEPESPVREYQNPEAHQYSTPSGFTSTRSVTTPTSVEPNRKSALTSNNQADRTQNSGGSSDQKLNEQNQQNFDGSTSHSYEQNRNQQTYQATIPDTNTTPDQKPTQNQNLNDTDTHKLDNFVTEKNTSSSESSIVNSEKQAQNSGGSTINQLPVPLSVNLEVPQIDPPGGKYKIQEQKSNRINFDSEEAQVPQETASFYKNSFNKIEQDVKSTTNVYPNHRSTYSELKQPKFYSTKSFTSLSSVTPQYLTTQPINNGKPFIGSQVGTSLKANGPVRITGNYFSTTSTVRPFSSGKTGRAFSGFSQTSTTLPTTTIFDPSIFSSTSSTSDFTTETPTTERFNIGRTDKILPPLSSSAPFSIKPVVNVTAPSVGSLNVGTTGTAKSKIETSTGRIIDHATVYGKFVKSSVTAPTALKATTYSTSRVPTYSTTSTNSRKIISLSKSLFNSNNNRVTTPSPKVTSSEILSTSGSFNRNVPQVRFFGKVQTTKIPGVEVHFNGNSAVSKSTPVGFNSVGTTAKPFGGSTINSFSIKSTSDTPSTSSYFSTTINPEFNSVAPFVSTAPAEGTTTPSPNTYLPKSKTGFFVTKNIDGLATPQSTVDDIVRPRPFQLPPEQNFSGKAVYTSPRADFSTPEATPPTYKISSASPFSSSSPEPTQPTFTSPKPTLPSTFENVDSMINALAEMASHNNFSDSPRPGLIIPPSAGPQTLHTLAVYFANALDGISADKEEDGENINESLTKTEMEKKKLTELLTQMTMDRYNELFNDDKELEVATIASRTKTDDDDLEGQNSKGLLQEPPKVRQLAKVFTQALSSYLDDPATFRKVLEEVRPTEPPVLEEEATDLSDDELLNFSDADSKSSFPPFFPTLPSVRPTWGYLLAYNTSQNLDVKNSISQENENLQGADSQSLVSQFNKLQNSKKEKPDTTTAASVPPLPEDHWTTSPDVNRLWKKTFAFDPASINANFGTTEPTVTTTDEDEPQEIESGDHEIQYELRALPQLDLNSTQVHGILIDFMNTSRSDESNRLQRILRKLNTTEDEFLSKMKEIESNPLTRRLILLLINECGSNATQKADPLQLSANSSEVLETASSNSGVGSRQEEKKSSSGFEIVDPSLADDSQDTRALQLLNSLYTIASRFGK